MAYFSEGDEGLDSQSVLDWFGWRGGGNSAGEVD